MNDFDLPLLTDLWRLMARIRWFEERVHEEVAANRLEGYVHTYAGEEAVAVGVIPLLRDTDWLTSTYRNHGHAIARGVPLDAIAGELLGKATGVCGGKGGSMHVADQNLGMIGAMGIVAGGLPIATGAAFAARYREEDRVAVAFFGDGAVHQGTFHEAMTFASLFTCPVLFVCENNLYAETTAVDYHLVAGSVTAMADPYRVEAHQVDGMDVFVVRAAANEAINRARESGRPQLLEAMTYRYYGQYEGDTQTYKPPAEVDKYRGLDPLDRFRTRVAAEAWVPAETLDRIEGEVRDEVDAAFASAAAAPWPDLEMVTADVYTT
ncbi:MAG: thiamine pyrophosphate-dependent dehydrogenase E1 component subunit alpha [Acidimicrobiia bacterium]